MHGAQRNAGWAFPHCAALHLGYLGGRLARIETPQALIGSSSSRRPGVLDSGLAEHLRQPAARIEHAGLHGAGLDSDDLGDLFDRLVMVIDEIDDLALCGRELGEALLQQRAALLLAPDGLRVVRGVLDGGGIVVAEVFMPAAL